MLSVAIYSSVRDFNWKCCGVVMMYMYMYVNRINELEERRDKEGERERERERGRERGGRANLCACTGTSKGGVHKAIVRKES